MGKKCTLIVDQPALKRPATPSVLNAERITAPQKGATSSDQSAVLMSCRAGERCSHRHMIRVLGIAGSSTAHIAVAYNLDTGLTALY